MQNNLYDKVINEGVLPLKKAKKDESEKAFKHEIFNPGG